MAIKVDGEKYIQHNGYVYRRLKPPTPYKLNQKQKEQRKLYMREYRMGLRKRNPTTALNIVETLI